MKNIDEAILKLIKTTSTILPDDIVQKLKIAKNTEKNGSAANNAICEILENIELAEKNAVPICQDTGTNIFEVEYPYNFDYEIILKSIERSIIKATQNNYLRPNSVVSLTGENTGNNIGKGHPSIELIPTKNDYIKIRLMLKGGGCENQGFQFSLPDETISAHRDIEGVKKCILHGIHQAQGFGCAPGIIGVCIGGDRADSMKYAKKQLYRKLDQENPDKILNNLEKELCTKANELGIGPMGYGGKTTVLGIHITSLNRIPASFFVSIAYMCWACRRRTLTLFPDGRFEIE